MASPMMLHLLGLTQRLGAREDVVAAGMAVLVQRARRHGRDIALVDRCRLGRAVRPSDDARRFGSRPPTRTVTFDANIPGRMIVDARPAAAIRRSMPA